MTKPPHIVETRRHLLTTAASCIMWATCPPQRSSVKAAEQGLSTTDTLPRALVFDIFGTTTDWRSSVIREGQRLSLEKGFQVDWGAFADAWRAGYLPIMQRVRQGELPWATIDRLHRMVLEKLLVQFDVGGLSVAEIDAFNRVWHRLEPWPDTIPGLARLKRRFIIIALSNGNMSMLVNLSKRAQLPWDCILSAELAGHHFKPDKQVYQTASSFLDLPPAEIMMVTTHDEDMRGALNAGFRVAYVHRPLEYGVGVKPAFAHADLVTVVADDFVDLAKKLGA